MYSTPKFRPLLLNFFTLLALYSSCSKPHIIFSLTLLCFRINVVDMAHLTQTFYKSEHTTMRVNESFKTFNLFSTICCHFWNTFFHSLLFHYREIRKNCTFIAKCFHFSRVRSKNVSLAFVLTFLLILFIFVHFCRKIVITRCFQNFCQLWA